MSCRNFKFRVGQRVTKPKGYRFDATVLAVFTNLSGEVRVVAENGDGLLHIFNESQLEAVRDEETIPTVTSAVPALVNSSGGPIAAKLRAENERLHRRILELEMDTHPVDAALDREGMLP